MKPLRRILGVFVMAAGIIGLLLSLAGLAGLLIIRPVVNTSIKSAVNALYTSVDSSQKTLAITDEALDATIDSINTLAVMLDTTSQIVEDTRPVVTQMNAVMGNNLPATFEAAGDSLQAAQGAATSLETTIQSIETFQKILSAIPIISSMLPQNQTPYNPEKPLADSLGDLSTSIEDMPTMFTDMSKDLDKADNNLENVKTNLDDMSNNITRISKDLEQYRDLLTESQASMAELKNLLGNLQKNLPAILTTASIALGLFFLWLLATQVVIFSQGWELYHGTANRMEPVRNLTRLNPNLCKLNPVNLSRQPGPGNPARKKKNLNDNFPYWINRLGIRTGGNHGFHTRHHIWHPFR
ncbi:MAG: hypothetical protein AB9891_04390 [Anaerolineaceae bacterium]